MTRGIATRAVAGGHSVRPHDRSQAKAEELAAASRYCTRRPRNASARTGPAPSRSCRDS
ncbi:hypothetical protein ACH4S8_41465 [Streptomyces sp. NPDC021080]|uniref:hypothetical protein n=1 Tax=Streptomyces sp. NPDC021080 TaxID=3365110 RepID=UPI0037B2F430